jgi:hypothetical protein
MRAFEVAKFGRPPAYTQCADRRSRLADARAGETMKEWHHRRRWARNKSRKDFRGHRAARGHARSATKFPPKVVPQGTSINQPILPERRVIVQARLRGVHSSVRAEVRNLKLENRSSNARIECIAGIIDPSGSPSFEFRVSSFEFRVSDPRTFRLPSRPQRAIRLQAFARGV